MKELTGSAAANTRATPEQAMALLEAIDRYPEWHGDVIREAEVLERDARGHPTRARTKLHVERGPLTRDFNLVMSVNHEAGMVKLSRIPHEPTDKERFDVTWHVDGGKRGTQIRLDLAANLDVPRLVPLGGVGDAMAEGLVSAATRELG